MLNSKQNRFIDEYLIDLNATQAAIRAGYSVKTANEQGNRLLANVSIQKEIQKRMKDRAKRTEFDQDEIVNQLRKIAGTNIKDFLSFRTEKTKTGIDMQTGEDIIDYAHVVDLKNSDEVDGNLINEISLGKDGQLKFKLHDKIKALELLGKHTSMFDNKLNIPDAENLKFETPGEVLNMLSKILSNKNTTENTARCVGYLSGIILKAYEVIEVESRLEKLEEQLSESEGNK